MTDFAPSVLPPFNDYEALRRQFSWRIPAAFNIAVAVCDRWAVREPRRVAIVQQHADGRCDAVDYGALRETSNRLANTLRAHGIARGDRVALLLPQMPEVAAIHIAIYKLGAIALPLAALFGPDAIAFRLQNSGAKALITDGRGSPSLPRSRAQFRRSRWCCRSAARARARAISMATLARAAATVHAGGDARPTIRR